MLKNILVDSIRKLHPECQRQRLHQLAESVDLLAVLKSDALFQLLVKLRGQLMLLFQKVKRGQLRLEVHLGVIIACNDRAERP